MTSDPTGTEATATPRPVVLIHGLWVTNRAWDGWIGYFNSHGVPAIAPNWPGLPDDVESLRRDPSPLAGLGLGEIVEHYASIISGLEQPPVIIGHSFGGTITQILLDRGYGAAGIAIASASVKGVQRLPLSTLRTGWPVLKNPANRSRAVPLSPEQFRWRFTNDLDLEAARPLYDQYYVPASGRVLFQGGLANLTPGAVTKVNFRNKERAPLLFLAGGIDHVSPPALVRSIWRKQRRAGTPTDYEVLPGRTHFMVGQAGWEEVADRCLAWAPADIVPQRAAAPGTAEDR